MSGESKRFKSRSFKSLRAWQRSSLEMRRLRLAFWRTFLGNFALNLQTLGSFFEKQFASTAGGLHHGLDQRHAELPFLELEDAVNGAASRRSYGVFQERGMIACFENYTCRSLHGLRGE